MRCLPAGLALSALCPAGALRAVGSLSAAAAPDVDPTFGTDAGAGTKFLFLTHHKTGTNLMQQLCNFTAHFLSNGTEQCHWCYRALAVLPDGRVRCPEDNDVSHGPFRGTAGRFTLVSAVDAPDLRTLERWAPDYRAVHMVRDPVDMLVSDYQYEARLHGPGSQVTYDSTTSSRLWGEGFAIQDRLRGVSAVLSHFVDHMCRVQKATAGSPRTKMMDLQLFTDDFDAAAKELYSFMVGSSYKRMGQLLNKARRYDKKRQTAAEKKREYVSDPSAAPAVKSAVMKMVEAGDEAIVASTSCEGAAAARPWAQKLLHFGNAKPGVYHTNK